MSSRKSIFVSLAVLLTVVCALRIERSQGRTRYDKRGVDSPHTEAKPAASNVADDLAKLRGQWAQDLHDKQLDKIIALYAADAAFLAPSGGRFTGQTEIRGLFKTIMDTVTSNITFHSIVTESSGDLAFDSGDYSETLVPTKSGPDQHYKGDYLIVFRRQKDGAWLIVQQVWTFAGNDLLPPSK
jgi:ketosteroid isomerase-like protein